MADEFSLTDWLAKAKEDQKVAAQPLIVLAVLIFIGWKFFYSPGKVNLTKQQKENKAVEDQIKGLEEAVANKEQIQLEVNEFRKAREEAQKICYRKSEAPLFLQELRKLGKKAKVEFKSINPQPPVPKTFEALTYDEYPVKISFQGTFPQLGMFMRVLETQEKLIVTALPPLIPDASGTFKFDLLPTAYLIPDNLDEWTASGPTEGGAPGG